MNRLRRALLALIATGVLSITPVALAGGNGNGDNNGGNNDGKITICHATGSETNPYVEITISVNALPAHERHQDGEDIIPAPAEGCPNKKKNDGKKRDSCKKDKDCKKDEDH
jgi:hypothetical protein